MHELRLEICLYGNGQQSPGRQQAAGRATSAMGDIRRKYQRQCKISDWQDTFIHPDFRNDKEAAISRFWALSSPMEDGDAPAGRSYPGRRTSYGLYAIRRNIRWFNQQTRHPDY